jgi:hypothetical protein
MPRLVITMPPDALTHSTEDAAVPYLASEFFSKNETTATSHRLAWRG